VHVPEPYGVARNEAVGEDLRAHDLLTELENDVFYFGYPCRHVLAKPDSREIVGVEPRSLVVSVRLAGWMLLLKVEGSSRLWGVRLRTVCL
jgi:hypothetical protein